MKSVTVEISEGMSVEVSMEFIRQQAIRHLDTDLLNGTSTASIQVIEQVPGHVYTHWDCPACNEINQVSGNILGEVVECDECEHKVQLVLLLNDENHQQNDTKENYE